MRYGVSSGRGGTAVTAVLFLALLAAGLGYWRLHAVNHDLAAELRRVEALLLAADEKGSHLEQQRREASQSLKRSGAELQQLQQLRDEENTRCKHLQENMEQMSEANAALQKRLEDERDEQAGEMRDTAAKVDGLQAELEKARQQQRQAEAQKSSALAEAEAARADAAKTRQYSAGAAAQCQAQLQQTEALLAQCKSASGGAPSAVSGPDQPQPGLRPSALTQPGQPEQHPDVSGQWPGLQVPRAQLGQALLESGGMQQMKQAQGRLNAPLQPPLQQQQQQQRVLPLPPSGVKTSSSTRGPAGEPQLPEPHLRQADSAGVAPGAAEEDGPGVLQPPAGEDAEQLKAELGDEETAKDAALIRGLEELSHRAAADGGGSAGLAPRADEDAVLDSMGAQGEPLADAQLPPLR